jgi:hypothetical protein
MRAFMYDSVRARGGSPRGLLGRRRTVRPAGPVTGCSGHKGTPAAALASPTVQFNRAVHTRGGRLALFGADPGGENCFGIAALPAVGSFESYCCSSVDEAVRHGVGIDCPMWWSPVQGAAVVSIAGFLGQHTEFTLGQSSQ